MRKIILLILFLLSFAVAAQDSPEVISAANISRLQSIVQVNFAEINAEFDTGMFWMNDSASRIVWGTRQGLSMTLADLELTPMRYVIRENTVTLMGFTFSKIDLFTYGLYQVDDSFVINGYQIELDTMPLEFWMGDNNSLFLETMDETGQPLLFEYAVAEGTVETEAVVHQVSFPPDDVVRIGRIPPPYTVTSTLEGIVKLWNLETGEILYEVDNGTRQPSVFGAINNPPTHLVWRDNANESLYLLNFETGENRLIDELNGDYAQWFFLGHDASVILAVNLGFEPNIVAWDVATGERTVLGEYRQCNRPQPDMARLSADGTSLVIGCDTGLDIWRIVD